MISRRLSKYKPVFAGQSPAHFGSPVQTVSYLTKKEKGKKDWHRSPRNSSGKPAPSTRFALNSTE